MLCCYCIVVLMLCCYVVLLMMFLVVLLLLHLFSYFVVDCDKLQDKHVTDITIGFYTATSTASKSTIRNFSLNIGQIQVSSYPLEELKT